MRERAHCTYTMSLPIVSDIGIDFKSRHSIEPHTRE